MLNGSISRVHLNGCLVTFSPVRSSFAQGAPISCQEWVVVMQHLISCLNTLQAMMHLASDPLPSGSSFTASMVNADTMILRLEHDGTVARWHDGTAARRYDSTAVRDASRLFEDAGGPAKSVPKTQKHLTPS